MGLDIRIRGNDEVEEYSASYSSFNNFRKEIVRQAYGERAYQIYSDIRHATSEDWEYWDTINDKDLDLFIMHYDCEGTLSAKKCEKIYRAFERFNFNFDTPEQEASWNKHAFEVWKNMLKYCMDNKVQMEFL